MSARTQALARDRDSIRASVERQGATAPPPERSPTRATRLLSTSQPRMPSRFLANRMPLTWMSRAAVAGSAEPSPCARASVWTHTRHP